MPSPYQLIIQPTAERNIRSLPKDDIRRITHRIQLLPATPRPPGCKKLGEPDIYRVRQGDYRILYRVDDETRSVTILKVGHRREVYRS